MSYHFDPDKAITLIHSFIANQPGLTGLDGFVVGLSGGIDSALSATLAVGALGPDKVLGVLMPYKTSSPDSMADAMTLIRQLGIEHRVVEISPMIDAYYREITPETRLRAGNKMARERMSILFDIAHELNRLVLGTGNRTEICLGYTTLFGDSACSVNPIGDLYKTEVRLLAEKLGLPPSIRTKAPSADLWVDQTDEGEIGVTYADIDVILAKLIDENVTDLSTLEATGLEPKAVRRVVEMLNRNWFKRELAPVANLGRRAVPRRIELS
jgi:NAD+ synthase